MVETSINLNPSTRRKAFSRSMFQAIKDAFKRFDYSLKNYMLSIDKNETISPIKFELLIESLLWKKVIYDDDDSKMSLLDDYINALKDGSIEKYKGMFRL